MVDPQCGESAIVSMPIIDPLQIKKPSRRRQLEWYWGLRHGQIDLTDITVRVRQDMASRRRSRDPWAILPEPGMLQIMLECVNYNFRCLSTMRRSSIDYHPGSVTDSFCATESDAESVVRWPPNTRRSGSDGAASIDAPSPLDVSRILDWRADVSKYGIEALPSPDAPSHSLGCMRRPRVFKLSSDTVGYTSWHEPSRFSSNDWAYHRLSTSLWLPDGGGSRSTDEEQRARVSRRTEHDATVTTEVAVAGSAISCPRPDSPEIDCATAYTPPTSPCMEGEPVPSRSPSPCSRTIFHAEDIDRDASAEKENIPVCLERDSACGAKKRRRAVDALHFSCPRKRTKCH
ncbi:hypothetical protein FISHEDRAFT_76708 [Fistulina hepatica ATCC 64428]|uniref:Uncharacterized protein n=1 Tax=Fistulina hepatica ATCC 64428 TaxID=1128425 RepID=A0A0D7A3L8_9AGAR|nr:hypothetical protein FISHEDRAFT_76708 [Fistulina hepatica ATCC 64428]